MNTWDKKLRDSIIRVMNEEEAQIRAEIEKTGPHVFSKEFEEKMAKILGTKKETSSKE